MKDVRDAIIVGAITIILMLLGTQAALAQGGYGPWSNVYSEPKTCESGWQPVELTDDYINGFYNKLDKLNDYDLYAWIEFLEWDLRYQGVPVDSWQTPSRKTIIFRHLEGPIGIAQGMFDEGRIEIQIDVEYWSKLTKWEKLFLVYHEAGHDYWEIWHNEVQMLSPALSHIKNDISRRKFLEWRNEMFKHIADKNAKRNGACPVEDVGEESPEETIPADSSEEPEECEYLKN